MVEGTTKRRRAYRRGHFAEWFAAFSLLCKGYRIVAMRHRTKLGEIDLVARRGDLVAIVEVKARKTIEDAMNAVSFSAQQRIEGAADLWLAKQIDYARLSIRFDIVAVLPMRWPVHVENAWTARG